MISNKAPDTEKHNVPKENPVPGELLEFIREGGKFLIAGHKEPDGDCVGSQLVLASVLRRMGKEAVVCSAGPFKRSEVKPYEDLFAPLPAEKSGLRVIVVDCSAVDRTGDLEPFLEGLPLAMIDHHLVREDAAGPALGPVYVDAHAPSTTFMILKLIEALGMEPAPEEAELLFFGLCTDTGFFRYVGSNGAAVFEAAAALVRLGADPRAAFHDIYSGKSLDSRRLLGIILSRAEAYYGGKLIYSCEEYEESCRYGLESRDSDSMYQLFQSISGAEAIAVIRQETPDFCSVGFRSRDWVNVGDVAASFGGGGHKLAAGFRIEGTIAEIKPRIIKAFESIFNSVP